MTRLGTGAPPAGVAERLAADAEAPVIGAGASTRSGRIGPGYRLAPGRLAAQASQGAR